MANWYWEYQQGNWDAQWLDPRVALRDKFRNRLSDIDLWERILSQTQKDCKLLAKFYKDIWRLVSRLHQEAKKAELVETLRWNLRLEIMRNVIYEHR